MNAEQTGKRIQELRKEKGLTQKELAKALHVTDKAVSKWERGLNFPDLGLVESLARELDTTSSYLLGIQDETREEIVNSFTEISSQQTEEAYQDIQVIGWVNLLAGVLLLVFMHFINVTLQRNGLFFQSQVLLWLIYGLVIVVAVGAIYTLKKYKSIRKWETLDSVLTEVLVIDVLAFLGVQFFTGRNPRDIWCIVMFLIGSVCLQLLFYRVMKPRVIKALPMILALLYAGWGTWLYMTSDSWRNAELADLFVDNVSPAVFCLATWMVCELKSRRESGGKREIRS